MVSLVPRPRPAFCPLQYGKAERAWYLFSREHEVIGKLWKFAELTGCILRIFNRLHTQRSVCRTITSCCVFSTDYTLDAQCVGQLPPASQIHVVSYLVPWLFSLFWAQCAHAQSNPFYHPFYPDVTHVRKDTRPSPCFTVLKAKESWAGPGNEASYGTVYTLCFPHKLQVFNQSLIQNFHGCGHWLSFSF